MHAHKSEQMKINLFGSHLPIDEVTKGSLHLVFEKKNLVWMLQTDLGWIQIS
jgi:hypothetical protein